LGYCRRLARAEAEELRGRIAELAERLAGVEERLSRQGPDGLAIAAMPLTVAPRAGRA
jgi:hypothetical protein